MSKIFNRTINHKFSENPNKEETYKTVNFFQKVNIPENDKIINPDLIIKLQENKLKLKNYINTNFAEWEDNKIKYPNLYKDRKPSALRRMIEGMKQSFFGQNGKITKKIPFMKKIYRDKNLEKVKKNQKISNMIIALENKLNFSSDFNKLQISQVLKDLPFLERKEFIKNSGMIHINKSIKNIKSSNCLNTFKTIQNVDKIERIKTLESTIQTENDYLRTENNFFENNFNNLNTLNTCNTIQPLKTADNSILNENLKTITYNKTQFSTPNKNYFSTKTPNNKNSPNSNSRHLHTSSNSYHNNSYIKTKFLIDSKFKEINTDCNKIETEVLKRIGKNESPINHKKRKITEEFDKIVLDELNSKILKNKQIKIKAGVSLIKTKGHMNNIMDVNKAKLINLTDKISKMNPETAFYFADKLVKEYNKNAVDAEVNVNEEFKKRYTYDIHKNMSEKMDKNNIKMKKIVNNILQEKKKINQIMSHAGKNNLKL